MYAENFFNSAEHLSPKCPGCGIKIELDVTTEWNDELESNVCKNCKTKIEQLPVF